MRTYSKQEVKIPSFRTGITVLYDREYDRPGTYAYCQIFPGEGDDVYNPWIILNALKPIPVGAIVHEILHTVRHVLKNQRGVTNLDEASDETLPYVIEYVLGEILKFCKRKKMKVVLSSS